MFSNYDSQCHFSQSDRKYMFMGLEMILKETSLWTFCLLSPASPGINFTLFQLMWSTAGGVGGSLADCMVRECQHQANTCTLCDIVQGKAIWDKNTLRLVAESGYHKTWKARLPGFAPDHIGLVRKWWTALPWAHGYSYYLVFEALGSSQ